MAGRLARALGAILVLACCGTQTLARIHEEGVCMMYSECGPNPVTKNRTNLNCLDNTAARPIEDPSGQILLLDLCPAYDSGSTCCDSNQLRTLQPLVSVMRPTFGRCPACLANVETLICTLVCNPDQSLYANASVLLDNPQGPAVSVIDAWVTENFANVSFDSCKTVQFPAANTPVMDVMCGGYLGDDCTPQRWLDFMGNTINGFIPWDIRFTIVPEGERADMDPTMEPMDPRVYYCDEMVGDQSACSCQDCEQACPPLPTIGPKVEPFTIGLMDGYDFIILFAYLGLSIVFILGLVVYGSMRKEKAADDEADVPLKNERIQPKDVGRLDKINKKMDDGLRDFFTWWGTLMATYPLVVLFLAIAAIAGLSCGVLFIKVVTDPVELWSGENSRSRIELNYFDETFEPFYRSTLIYIRPTDPEYETYDTYLEGNKVFGPMVKLDMLTQTLDLQKAVEAITVEHNNKTVGLTDVCNKPLAPVVDVCLIQSVLQWFGNSYEQLNRTASDVDGNTANYRDHFLYCMKSPLSLEDNTPLRDMCVSQFGGPSYAYVATGGYPEDDYNEAELLAITILLNNPKDDPEAYDRALAWEKEYLKFMAKYDNPNFIVAYSAERSIEDELIRQSEADVLTILISYLVIFAYIALALGEFNRMDRLLVDSKILLGLGGVVIVMSSVFTAIGTFGYFGVETTLIVIEVVPFLILAIGADNIFIFVLDYQRDVRREGETREQQIGRVLGQVGPSMMLCGLSESVSFFLGALTEMPAVYIFALYSGLSVLVNFILQITAFVALLSLDAKRQEAGRYDIICCLPPKHKDPISTKLGLLQWVMKKYFAPFIMNKWVRPAVVLVFGGFTAFCVALTLKLPVGLDQRLSMPEDSYMLTQMNTMGEYMKVGPPVYFVVTEGYNYSSMEGQNKVCGGWGCNDDSLTQQIYYASLIGEKTYIAQPTSSWMDDYFDWLSPQTTGSCCRYVISNNTEKEFCSSKSDKLCRTCIPQRQRSDRRDAETFEEYLNWFLDDVPNEVCQKGGSAAYGDAVQFYEPSTTDIKATYFMTYTTPLVTSPDYYNSLKEARLVADSIKESMMSNYPVGEDFNVFPYSIYYVYYEQYLTLVPEAIVSLLIALVPIFVVSLFMLGFSLWAPIIIIVNILMIVVDTMGVMYLWDIEFNAISLVNLVMAVGISVEFVSHMTRSFSVSVKGTRIERAEHSLATMGSSVLSGVALTNLPGIIVLAFATSQLFVVFYFRMFLTITLAGTVHGLIFLPVALSYVGPGVNKAYLLEAQMEEEREQRMKEKEAAAFGDKPPSYGQAVETEFVEKKKCSTGIQADVDEEEHAYHHVVETNDETRDDKL